MMTREELHEMSKKLRELAKDSADWNQDDK